ncbi:MAG: ATP-binding protein, partial [Anaerolineae bacterium]|nr:ATP-binding protein [Anaerolineae bacterium]
PGERASLQMAFSTAQEYSSSPTGWLLLEGTYGCGKTHLAAAVANLRLRQGDPVLFITSPDLLDHLRAAYAPNSDSTYDETFDRVRNTPLLILDDLGVENPSAWAQEKLFQLLNHRYNHNLPTIITTNMNIDRLDARVRSRLLDDTRTHRVSITAPDYRTRRQDELTQLTSSLPLYHTMTFETFDVYSNTEPAEAANLHKAVQIAWAYAQKANEHWLLLAGAYGTGKTHLAAAIANYWRTRSPNMDDIMFISASDLIDYLKMTFDPDTGISLNQRFQQIKNVPLLVLDDLGAETGSAWAREKLFQLIDYRYVTRKPTVFTTARDIEKLDERIRTRLFDKRICTLFELVARSYAIRQR